MMTALMNAVPRPKVIELYSHQKLALQYLRLNDGFALFLEQGCGKTLPTLCRINELLEQGIIQNALIVAPKAAMGAWLRDMELFDEIDRKRLANGVTIINYDSVWRGDKYSKQWGCIVLDESHKIKNRSSNRAKYLLKLSLAAHYRYILTGTPVGNGRLENIWAQYSFIFPESYRGSTKSIIFGTYYQFINRYALLNKYYQPYRYKCVDELQAIIAEHSYRVTKVECLDLPEKLPDEIYDIQLLESEIYKNLRKSSAIVELNLLAPNPLSKLLMLREVCSGFINVEGHVNELKCEKIKALEEFLDDWEKKLVIYCEFKHSIDSVTNLLTSLKINYVTLDGRQLDKLIWRKFQSDPDIKVIVCQYQSGSTGIDLFSADTIIYYEPTLSSTNLEQSRDRIHRSGQMSKCSYIHFITKGTVEVAIYKSLKEYSDFSEKLFNEYLEEYQIGVNY